MAGNLGQPVPHVLILPGMAKEDSGIGETLYTFLRQIIAIRVKMAGEAASRTCKTITKETTIGSHFGCPLCASVGLIISKVTGKPVTIEENKVHEVENVITTTYRTIEI